MTLYIQIKVRNKHFNLFLKQLLAGVLNFKADDQL